MSNCYGIVEGDRARTLATRGGHEYIKTTAKTWSSQINVFLDKNDNATIDIEGQVNLTLNGTKFFKTPYTIENCTIQELLEDRLFDFLKEKFREAVPRLRFPKKEFEQLTQAINAKILTAKIRGE